MTFALDSATRRSLGYKIIDHIDRYFTSLHDRPVQVPLEQRTFEPLRNPLPEIGGDAERILGDICARLITEGFHVPSGNYFGLMNPAPAYIAVVGEALVAALNPQLASMARSQLASKIEQETVRWIGERVYGPARSQLGWREGEFYGTFTSGGNEANFSALAAALAHHFPDAIENGVASIGAQPVVYASSEAHHSLDKSCGLLGTGRRALRRIPITDRIQLDVQQLETAINEDRRQGRIPFCVVATAGTTNSGAIDDITAIAEICRRYDLWLHVDGAYGAAAVFSEKHRELVRGIEQADSVIVDPHKWLAMPYAAGVVLTRHPQSLRAAFEVSTPYMPRLASTSAGHAPDPDNFKISTQWSRRANALKLWLTLQVHGRQAYEEHIDRQLRLARTFADWVERSENFELAAPMYVPIVNFRIKAESEEEIAAANERIVAETTRDGRQWISTTVVGGRSVIRMMVISYFTDEQNLEQLQAALTSAVQKVGRAALKAQR